MNRARKVALQLQAVEVLRMLKETRTYEELSAETGLPAGDLNRYVNGHVLPGVTRARHVIERVGREELAAELEARIRRDRDGYIDNTDLVFDQQFMDLVAPVAAESGGFDRPDVVLTAATDGITLGSALATHYDATIAYAKQSKETAVGEFIESRQRLTSGIELTYYLPAETIDPGQRVLVADDLIRSGETQELLLDIAGQAGASVAGVFSLIAAGDDGLDRVRTLTEAPVDTLVHVD